MHSAAGIPNPADTPFVTTVLEGLRQLLAKPTVKKEPEILAAMVEDATNRMHYLMYG